MCVQDSRSESESHKTTPLDIDFRAASFPSDALSVKRLRAIFPKHFDGDGRLLDGYANNSFFCPLAAEEPAHLMRLTELICDERVVAAGAFFQALYGDNHGYEKGSESIEEERECIERAKADLERNLQFFKLADSSETARLLIRQIEAEGERQAHARKSVAR
jgi:hypothetical protein